MLASESAQLFPSRNIWETIKDMFALIFTQLIHLVWICQGTLKRGLKACTTAIESDSNQIFCQPFSWANSIANIAPENSEMREFETPRKLAKAPRNLPSKSITIPPQAEGPEFPKEALSQLILIQSHGGGFQITYRILWTQGGWIVTLKFFNNSKPWILIKEGFLKLFPTIPQTDIIPEIEEKI